MGARELFASPSVFMGKLLVLLSLVMGIAACGVESNFFAWVTPSGHKKSWEQQVALGRIYYDVQDYDQALKHAEQAYQINPDSEEAAVLLGYVYLAKANLSPVSVVESLIAQGQTGDVVSEGSQESNSSAPESSSVEEDLPDGGDFGVLGHIIGLSKEEFNKMGQVNLDDPDLPVIEPYCANQVRKSVDKLKYVDRAIAVVCPFVDPDVRLGEDVRHRCQARGGSRRQRSESHFLWALAHVTEAAAFHSVMTYGTTGSDKTNLELRVEAIQNFDLSNPSQISSLITDLESLTQTIDNVLQVAGFCSWDESGQTQLLALVNDLIATTYAFSKMPGIPEDLISGIHQATGRIVAIREQTSGISQAQEQAASVRGGVTKSISKEVAAVLDKMNPETLTTEQQQNLCQSYGNISASPETSGQKPAICN